MVLLQRHVVSSRVCPNVSCTFRVAEACQRLVLVNSFLAFTGVTAVETALVRPCQTKRSLRAKVQARDGLPLQCNGIGIGISMLDELVDGDVALRVGVVEQLLLSRVGVGWVNIAKFTQTVGGTILQDVNDTAGSHMLTTGSFVTTIREFGVELNAEVLRYLDVGLEVNIGTAHTRT